MTYSARELEGVGVDPDMLAWRAWRRSMQLTIPEAAAMAGVDAHWLQRLETGKARMGIRARRAGKLQALMARWDESLRPPKPARARARR